MVSIFQPEKSKKMHNLPPFGKFFIKKPEEIKRRYKIRKKEVSLHERTGLHRTHRCNHRSRQLGLDRILPPRPRRPDLRKHDVAEPHHLRGCRHLRSLPDLRLRKNFRPRTGTGVRTGPSHIRRERRYERVFFCCFRKDKTNIAALCMVLSRDMDQKKKKYRMLLMQLSCAVLLASDAAAWAFRGSPGSLERGIVYVSNDLV